jgi:hypothetical protein
MPISDFHHFNDGRMDASPPTQELQTKMGYQKKRKTMVYPMVQAAAVKFYHSDQQDDEGIFPSLFGIYPEKVSFDSFASIALTAISSGEFVSGYWQMSQMI